MRVSINLASRPFLELRPLFARLRLAMVVLALLAAGLAFALHGLTERASVATTQMKVLEDTTHAYQQERASNEARMRQPQNRAALDRAVFLNSLFAHKSFSWTAVMMDLERVLPPGVQVTSIEPVIGKEGDVNIRLRVTGDRDRAIQLVRNLEHSQRFLAPRLAGESALTADKAKALGSPVQAVGLEQVGNGVEFEIFSGYNPLPEPKFKAGAADAEDAPDILSAPDANPAQVRHNRRSGAKAVAR